MAIATLSISPIVLLVIAIVCFTVLYVYVYKSNLQRDNKAQNQNQMPIPKQNINPDPVEQEKIESILKYNKPPQRYIPKSDHIPIPDQFESKRDLHRNRQKFESSLFQNNRDEMFEHDWRNDSDENLYRFKRPVQNWKKPVNDYTKDFVSFPGATFSEEDARLVSAKYDNFEKFTPDCPIGYLAREGYNQIGVASNGSKVYPLCSKPDLLESEQDRYRSHYDYLVVGENRLPIYLNETLDDKNLTNNQLIEIPGYADKFKVSLTQTDNRMYIPSY